MNLICAAMVKKTALHGNLGDDDLSVTDFVGDSSPGRGAKAAALNIVPCLPFQGNVINLRKNQGLRAF